MTGSPGNYNDWYPLPKFTGEDSEQFLFSNNSEQDSQWGPQLFNIRSKLVSKDYLLKMAIYNSRKWK